jgi:hypothetical protein
MVVVEDDLKETRSETGNGDMLIKEQANTSANAAKKRKQKEISVPVEDVDKTNEFVVKRSNLPKSTNDLNSKINGNVAKPHAEKRSKRGTRQPNGTTSKNAAEGLSLFIMGY